MCAVIARLAVLVTMLVACGDPPANVHLVPIDLGGTCGRPARADVRTMSVISYATSGEHSELVSLSATGEVDISDFPADTEQLGVELAGDSGVISAGKSAPLPFDTLHDGVAIPIAVLPLGGFCRTMDLIAARAQPLVARAGDGVLVVGGSDAAGNPLPSAEYYDRTAAQFFDVPVPVQLDATGFSGAALAELSDGTVLVTAPQHVALLFDPVKRTFAARSFYEDRALHAMLEVEPGTILVAGGCVGVAGGACMTPVHGTYRIPVASLGDAASRTDAATIDTTQDVARLFDLGTQLDGTRGLVLAGSQTTAAIGERFDPYSVKLADEVPGFHAQVAELPGGALLTAFDPDGSPQTGAVGQLAPDAAMTAPLGPSPMLDGARLVAGEDGSVLAIGGDATGVIWRYLPTTDAWQTILPTSANLTLAGSEPPGPIAAPALARLADGSVLIVGSTISGQPSASAWLFRPSLVGPSSGSLIAAHDGSGPGVLVASDPATVTRTGGALRLTGGGPTARVLVGGPRNATGSIGARVQVRAGGVALVAQQVGPGRALIATLAPGAMATIGRLDHGTTTPLPCSDQQIVPAFDAASTTVIGLAIAGHTATLTISGASVATCDLSQDADAADRGEWGVAAAGSSAMVDVVTVTVSRSPAGA